jgi:ribonucleoside-triphosphate reductase
MNKIIEGYLDKSDWRIFENSNMGYSLQGLNNHITSELIKDYWLKMVYPESLSKAHVCGDIHIHDLGCLSVYCCGWDLYDIMLRGFSGVPTKVECKPPKHFRPFLGQICNFFYTLQGESAGANAFSSFDTYLAPYIAYDKLGYREVYQAMQEFVFNMNVPTRVGFQSPFTNITFDLVCPNYLKSHPVYIGGEKWEEYTFGDFQKEMDMINRAFCEVMMEGDGNGKLFSFPIPTYNLTKKFNWDSEVTEYIFAMTAKFGIPYFANYINSDMKPEDARSMCCRLRIDTTTLKRGGLFSSNPLTGSQGVVTINLPAIGYRSKGKDKSVFMSDLLAQAELARQSLKLKRAYIEKRMEDGLYPYSKVYLENVKKRTGSYFANHFSTIGILGAHEACLNYLGNGIETEEGKLFSKEILMILRKEMERFATEDKVLYNLEATPGEGTTYSFAKKDLARYPDIIIAGTKEEPYYTNSTQLPVGHSIDILKALRHQEELQAVYTGGTVFHVYLGESIYDVNLCKKFVRKIAENYTLPYFSLTPTFSICPEHGFLFGAVDTCPKCVYGGNSNG